MTANGLSVLDNAALHFLTRFPSPTDTSDDPISSSSSSDRSTGSEGCGSAVTVLLEGVRPQPVEIQALCSLRDRQSDDSSSSSSAAAAAAVGGDVSDDSSSTMAAIEEEEYDYSGGGGGNSNDSEFDTTGSDWEEGSREQGGREDGGGAPFYAFKNAIGLKDRQRLSMLTTILSEHTAIKVGP